jgi:hypothetical protein
MNCEQFESIIGMRCAQMGSAMEIITPFTFGDGDGFELFAKPLENHIHFHDDGFTLLHLHSVGIQLGGNKNKWKPLKTIAENYGVSLSNSGVFEVFSPINAPGAGFAKMVSTLLGIATWEREQTGIVLDRAALVDEVAFYLQAWKPTARLFRDPTIQGFSRRILHFDFQIDGQYVDAMNPHGASTGAELRKIVDLTGSQNETPNNVLIVVDDRTHQEAAKQETAILSRIASVWPMSRLIDTAGKNVGTAQ